MCLNNVDILVIKNVILGNVHPVFLQKNNIVFVKKLSKLFLAMTKIKGKNKHFRVKKFVKKH